MPYAVHVEPFSRGFLATANLVAHCRIENFRATASDRAETSVAQDFQCIANRQSEDALSKMPHLDRSECLDVKLWIERAQSAQKIEVPVLFQGGMQPTHHVDLGDAQPQRIVHDPDDFINRIFEGVCVALF